MSKNLIRIAIILLAFAMFVNGQTETKRYAIITQTGGVIVRADIEPGANMVVMAREGQRFEVIGEPGKLWLKINTESGEGYIPISSCRIKEGLNSNPVGTVILLLVLVGAAGGGAYLYYTKRKIVSQEGDSVPI